MNNNDIVFSHLIITLIEWGMDPWLGVVCMATACVCPSEYF